jgi:UDP-N-acetylmuramyl pentapeptide phosphotransferase/UDP-N-acetylglucosamine-1-phosphate transferase
MFWEMLAALVVAALIGGLLGPVVIAAGVMDMPDGDRRHHAKPTPKAGGVAAAVGMMLGVAGVCLWPDPSWSAGLSSGALARMGGVGLFALAILILGLCDDIWHLGPRLKFGLMALMGLILAALVARAEYFPFGGGIVLQTGLVIGVLGSALWVFTMINATNFLDGSNGLAMGSMAIGLTGLGVMGLLHAAPHAAVLAFAGAGGLIGMLIWNFPNGRLFAGDTGSLFAGALAAGVGLLVVQDGGVTPLAAPILFFPMLADVLLTLAYRVKRKRRILDGHREHLYQIGLRSGRSAPATAFLYWSLTAACGVIGVLVSMGPRLAPPEAFAPRPGDVEPSQVFLIQSAAWFAALTPWLAFIGCALVALVISHRVRRFADARGLTAPT